MSRCAYDLTSGYREEKILAAIARIGYPTVPSKPAPAKGKHKSLKSVVQSVVFINRSRYVISPAYSSLGSECLTP